MNERAHAPGYIFVQEYLYSLGAGNIGRYGLSLAV